MAGLVEFKIKDKSIVDFFSKYSPEFATRNNRGDNVNPYYLFKDEIILSRKVYEIIDQTGNQKQLTFEMSDRGRVSDKELINIYTYQAEPYDLMSVKLTLVNFEVKAVNEKII